LDFDALLKEATLSWLLGFNQALSHDGGRPRHQPPSSTYNQTHCRNFFVRLPEYLGAFIVCTVAAAAAALLTTYGLVKHACSLLSCFHQVGRVLMSM